jgi:hypothetical protein
VVAIVVDSDKRSKYMAKELREHFENQHKGWITFLNWTPALSWRTSAPKDDRVTNFTKEERELMENEVKTAPFRLWEVKPFDTLFTAIGGNTQHLFFYNTLLRKSAALLEFENSVGKEYSCDLEVFTYAQEWMRANLRSVEDGSNELIDTANFGRKAAEVILSKAFLTFRWKMEDDQDDLILISTRYTQEPLTQLINVLYAYMLYIQDAILYLNFKKKRPLWFYKVGICRYDARGKPECRVVYIGKAYTSQACEKHMRYWKEIKYNRKKSLEKKTHF